MGCWNKTCGLSNLHIYAGTPVYVFVLEQQSSHERCYSTAFWRPVIFPFMSVYDDYGGGEHSSPMINHVLEGLKKAMIEIPAGENEYHDIAVSRDALDERLFFEAVHEGRLLTADRYSSGTQLTVDFTMFRKDVVDDILENWTREHYVGDGKGTVGWDNNYIPYNFADVLADVPAFVDRIEAEVSRDDYRPCLQTVFEWNDPNKVSWFLRFDGGIRSPAWARPADIITELIRWGSRTETELFVIECLKGAYLDSFLTDTRKVWMPGGHEGSQSSDQTGYRVLCKAIVDALDREQAELEDE